MNEEERNKIYEDALKFWGIDPQLRIAQEECGEFIVAASHFIRNREGSLEKLAEETADVYIMMKQVMKWVGEEKVLTVADEKLGLVSDKLAYYKSMEEE
jgi:NTP pyrophosphatase (non-canonical NTP hydrolase)